MTARACACCARRATRSEEASRSLSLVSRENEEWSGRRFGDLAGAQLPHPFRQPVERSVVQQPGADDGQDQQGQDDEADPEPELRPPASGPFVQLHQIVEHHQHALRLAIRRAEHRGEQMNVGIGHASDFDGILRCRQGLADHLLQHVGKISDALAGGDQPAIGAVNRQSDQSPVAFQHGAERGCCLAVRQLQRHLRRIGHLMRDDVGAAIHLLQIVAAFAFDLKPGQRADQQPDQRGDQQSHPQRVGQVKQGFGCHVKLSRVRRGCRVGPAPGESTVPGWPVFRTAPVVA